MPVSLFENKPECCPFGHKLWPGKAQVSWKPCICASAREAAARGRGMGHAMITYTACHDQLRQTTFYEPAHGRRKLRGWPSGCYDLGPPVGVTDEGDNLLGGENPGDAVVAQGRPGWDILDIGSAQQVHYGVDRLAACTEQFRQHPAAGLVG